MTDKFSPEAEGSNLDHDFKPAEDWHDLEGLARHYLEHVMDSECCWMALTRVAAISRILGEDLIDRVLALAVYCEECGEEFLREDLDLVVCMGCGGAALVCQGCANSSS